MKLATIRTIRRWNNVAMVCSLIVCLSGIVQILEHQRYWLAVLVLVAGGLTELTLTINLRPEKGRRRVMPDRFEELAAYNAAMHPTRWVDETFYTPDGTALKGARIESVDVDRSIYSPAEHVRMAALQVEYHAWQRAELERKYPEGSLIDMPGGGVLVFPEGVDQHVGTGLEAFVDEMLAMMRPAGDATAANVEVLRDPTKEEKP